MMDFPAPEHALPFISTEQMREVDRLMIEEYGILLIQMMENAGRNLAHLARRRFLDGDSQGSRVLMLAGTGGNGGGVVIGNEHHPRHIGGIASHRLELSPDPGGTEPMSMIDE